MDRRGFLEACFAAACAPAIVRIDSLMRPIVRPLIVELGDDGTNLVSLGKIEQGREGYFGAWREPSLDQEIEWIIRRAFIPILIASPFLGLSNVKGISR